MKLLNFITPFLLITSVMCTYSDLSAQTNTCIVDRIDNLDDVLTEEMVKPYIQDFEFDHYINGKGTKYVESQYFFYSSDDQSFFIKLYSIKAVKGSEELLKFKKKTQSNADDVYKYELAQGVGDYALWEKPMDPEESSSSTNATLKVLFKDQSFVIQVDLGNFTKSQDAAIKLANSIIAKC